jgi:hypothetical protein
MEDQKRIAAEEETTPPIASTPKPDTPRPRKRKVKRKNPWKPGRKPNPWMDHVKLHRKRNPDWQKTMTYKELLQHCKTTYVHIDRGSPSP